MPEISLTPSLLLLACWLLLDLETAEQQLSQSSLIKTLKTNCRVPLSAGAAAPTRSILFARLQTFNAVVGAQHLEDKSVR